MIYEGLNALTQVLRGQTSLNLSFRCSDFENQLTKWGPVDSLLLTKHDLHILDSLVSSEMVEGG